MGFGETSSLLTQFFFALVLFRLTEKLENQRHKQSRREGKKSKGKHKTNIEFALCARERKRAFYELELR